MKIKDIEGLNSLDLSNIKTLILDNNAISRVTASDFETLLGVNVISMQNCGLDYFTLNPELERVNELRLSNNNLTEIEIPFIGKSIESSSNYLIVKIIPGSFSGDIFF